MLPAIPEPIMRVLTCEGSEDVVRCLWRKSEGAECQNDDVEEGVGRPGSSVGASWRIVTVGEAASGADREVMITFNCQNQITVTVSIAEGEMRGERGGVEAVVGAGFELLELSPQRHRFSHMPYYTSYPTSTAPRLHSHKCE